MAKAIAIEEFQRYEATALMFQQLKADIALSDGPASAEVPEEEFLTRLQSGIKGDIEDRKRRGR